MLLKLQGYDPLHCIALFHRHVVLPTTIVQQPLVNFGPDFYTGLLCLCAGFTNCKDMTHLIGMFSFLLLSFNSIFYTGPLWVGLLFINRNDFTFLQRIVQL